MVSTRITKLVQHIAEQAVAKNIKIALIEDCTGGMISSAITENINSKKILDYSIILSSMESKKLLLDIETKSNKDEINEENCEKLAKSLKIKSPNSLILAIIGNIDEEINKEELGSAFITIISGPKIIKKHHHFPGNRHDIRLNITETALESLLNVTESVEIESIS